MRRDAPDHLLAVEALRLFASMEQTALEQRVELRGEGS
jgi:hypothetical protein